MISITAHHWIWPGRESKKLSVEGLKTLTQPGMGCRPDRHMTATLARRHQSVSRPFPPLRLLGILVGFGFALLLPWSSASFEHSWYDTPPRLEYRSPLFWGFWILGWLSTTFEGRSLPVARERTLDGFKDFMFFQKWQKTLPVELGS